MAIGAEDYIDQLLVKKYAEEKVDNHDNMESMMMILKQKLNIACYAINARTAKYQKSPAAQY